MGELIGALGIGVVVIAVAWIGDHTRIGSRILDWIGRKVA